MLGFRSRDSLRLVFLNNQAVGDTLEVFSARVSGDTDHRFVSPACWLLAIPEATLTTGTALQLLELFVDRLVAEAVRDPGDLLGILPLEFEQRQLALERAAFVLLVDRHFDGEARLEGKLRIAVRRLAFLRLVAGPPFPVASSSTRGCGCEREPLQEPLRVA